MFNDFFIELIFFCFGCDDYVHYTFQTAHEKKKFNLSLYKSSICSIIQSYGVEKGRINALVLQIIGSIDWSFLYIHLFGWMKSIDGSIWIFYHHLLLLLLLHMLNTKWLMIFQRNWFRKRKIWIHTHKSIKPIDYVKRKFWPTTKSKKKVKKISIRKKRKQFRFFQFKILFQFLFISC